MGPVEADAIDTLDRRSHIAGKPGGSACEIAESTASGTKQTHAVVSILLVHNIRQTILAAIVVPRISQRIQLGEN
jgi:hypothetical protein